MYFVRMLLDVVGALKWMIPAYPSSESDRAGSALLIVEAQAGRHRPNTTSVQISAVKPSKWTDCILTMWIHASEHNDLPLERDLPDARSPRGDDGVGQRWRHDRGGRLAYAGGGHLAAVVLLADLVARVHDVREDLLRRVVDA